jgi:hypothetical protein
MTPQGGLVFFIGSQNESSTIQLYLDPNTMYIYYGSANFISHVAVMSGSSLSFILSSVTYFASGVL